MSKRRPRRIHKPAMLGRRMGGWGGGHVNVTPMIDVVMCLIVFYLIVGRLASQQLATIELPPSAVGKEEHRSEVLVVNLVLPEDAAPSGDEVPGAGIVVDGRELDGPRALEAVIRQRLLEKPETAVQIRAERRMPYAQVEPALHACARAGASTVQLMAERTAPTGETGGGP